MKPSTQSDRAFTLVELMVVLAVAFVLFIWLLPMDARDNTRAKRINCANNLKSLGVGFRLWVDDHAGKFPVAVSITNGGIMEFATAGNAYRHFAVMSNELGTLRILLCPADGQKELATNFPSLRNLNISYFVSLSVWDETQPQMWLAGDRNLTNGAAAIQGVLEVPTNSPVGWTEKLHQNAGNLLLADGSVHQMTNRRLRDSLISQTNSPLRLAMPQ